MDKRYQVFVSSTFEDLKEERARIMQLLVEANYFPAGMEYFPAIDEEQLEFIKKVIKDSDYYIIIIGDRYGSLANDGISYTEKEFDFAISKGKKVVAIIKKESTESDKIKKAKLDSFKQKVASGRIVKYWENSHEISGLVLMSLIKTINSYPAIGWIKGDSITNPELLKELNELRKENNKLLEVVNEKDSRKNVKIDLELADFNQKILLSANSFIQTNEIPDKETTWSDLFSLISPYLIKTPSEGTIKSIIESEYFGTFVNNLPMVTIETKIMNLIRVQFMAYGLIEVSYLKTTDGGKAIFWNITELGKIKMLELVSVKK